jgi:hypothetical protein
VDHEAKGACRFALHSVSLLVLSSSFMLSFSRSFLVLLLFTFSRSTLCVCVCVLTFFSGFTFAELQNEKDVITLCVRYANNAPAFL